MTSNFPLLLKRVGLTTVALTGYGTAVYFTTQFMTEKSEDGNTNAKQAQSSSSSLATTTSSTACNCNEFSHITAPDRVETFQKIAKVYDDQISRDEFVMGLPLLRRMLLYFHCKGNVLEVGAGTGRNLNYYPSSATKVVLTDTSDQMLLKARQKIKSGDYGEKFQIFVADAGNMTNHYEDNSFDTIVSTFTLCSFDDPVKVLQELQSLCKPDGKILLLEHGRTKRFEGLSNYLDKYADRHAKNWGCVWNRDLDDIINKAGLQIDKIDTWHFGTTYYIVCRPNLEIKEDRRLQKEIIKAAEGKEMMETQTKSQNVKTKRTWWKYFS
mmetsp:Transcript_3303/g.3800  ORF Transcript_3303/g.3800 Transcript_3303/m.3800 type:complete len:325 (-) Transcript_3303:473-1447(-)